MSLRIPEQVARKDNQLPESSYGACIVTLVLRDGRQIQNVALAWNTEIIKLGGRDIHTAADLDFDVANIVDAFPEK